MARRAQPSTGNTGMLPPELMAMIAYSIENIPDLSRFRAIDRGTLALVNELSPKMTIGLDCRDITTRMSSSSGWFGGHLEVTNFTPDNSFVVSAISGKCKDVRVRGARRTTVLFMYKEWSIPNLTSLDLWNCTLSANAMSAYTRRLENIFPALTSLFVGRMLGQNDREADEILAIMCSAGKMKHLGIRGYNIANSKWLKEIGPHLRTLSLPECRVHPVTLYPWPLYQLSAMLSLTSLDLSGCEMEDAWLRPFLPNLMSLKILNLARCRNLTDGTPELLCLMPNLAVLSLSACPLLTLDSLVALVETPMLRTLDITRCSSIRPSPDDEFIRREGRTVDLWLLVSAPIAPFEGILAPDESRVFVKLGDEDGGNTGEGTDIEDTSDDDDGDA